MEAKKIVYRSIREYIQDFPPDLRERLERIYETVKAAAPDAEEKISYNMPSFHFKGYLVYFSAFKKHIGFYPASNAVFEVFRTEMAGFKQSGKGTVQFPHSKPLPLELIKKIVEFRLAENEEKARLKAEAARKKSER